MRTVALLGFAASVLAILGACEDNEYPFDDAWYGECLAEGAPVMTAVFERSGHLDDFGNRREYLGRVEVAGPDFPDVWLWQVEIDLRDDAAATVLLEHLPVPDEYVDGEPWFEPIDLDVATYRESDDTTSATMTGECAYGDATGDLVMTQSDDCDLCFDCDTGGAPASLGPLAPLLALLVRRARSSKRALRTT